MPGSATLRAWGTATGCALLLFAVVAARGIPWLACLFSYGFVVVLGRSRLPWLDHVRWRPIVKLAIRSAVFYLPLPIVGVPYLHWNTLAVLMAAGLATVGLWLQRRELRIALDSKILRLQPHTRRDDRIAYTLHYAVGGASQEYLYRGALTAALHPLLGWWAIGVVAVLFVLEHLAQPRASWDAHDVAWQATLSVTLGVLVLAASSLPAAMIGHTLYNAPNAVRAARRPLPTAPPGPHTRAWAGQTARTEG